MKRLLLLASAFALIAGCASHPTYRGTTGTMGAGTDAGYGIGVAPNQQGSGAVQLTSSLLTTNDLQFLRRAAEFNETDIQLGRDLIQRSDNPAVKTLGHTMVDNHTMANSQLQAIIAQTGATFPTSPNAAQRQMLSQLEACSGADLDRAATDAIVREHEREVNLYSEAVNNAQTPPVKAYAQQNLPAIQNELNMARGLSTPALAPTGAPSGYITAPPQQQ